MNLSKNEKLFLENIDRLGQDFESFLNFVRKQGAEFDRSKIFESWAIDKIADLQTSLIELAKELRRTD